MNEIIWKDVTSFEGKYQVSNKGQVKSLDREVYYSNGYTQYHLGKILTPILHSNGYLYVGLHDKKRTRSKSVHRLVAEAFIPNPDNKPCVNHKDGNKHINCVENLEWCTYSENHIHAIKTGLHLGAPPLKQGSQTVSAKLGETDIPMIRSLIKSGVMIITVADMYGLCPKTIRAIRDGITWKNVPL